MASPCLPSGVLCTSPLVLSPLTAPSSLPPTALLTCVSSHPSSCTSLCSLPSPSGLHHDKSWLTACVQIILLSDPCLCGVLLPCHLTRLANLTQPLSSLQKNINSFEFNPLIQSGSWRETLVVSCPEGVEGKVPQNLAQARR